MMFTMLLAVAEFEPRRISQRTKEALGVMRANGRKIGNIPYGFAEYDGVLEPLPHEQLIIAEIKIRSESETLQQIADDLNTRLIPTKQCGKWFSSTVRNIARRKD